MIFSKEELRDPSTDILSVLKATRDDDLYDAILENDKYGMMMIHRFLKYRSPEEFKYLLSRLSSYYMEQFLSARFTITFKSSDPGSVKKRITGWHYLFAFQSLDNIFYILKRINSHGLFNIFQTNEEDLGDDKNVSWASMLKLNKNIPTEKADKLLSGINEFVLVMNICRTISSSDPQKFPENFSKIALLLGMNFKDSRPSFKNWGLLHFTAFATQLECEHQPHYVSLTSRIISNLNATLLRRIKDVKCGGSDQMGCNLLHFSLLYITNEDDIQTLCYKAGFDITNQWLCERIRCHPIYDGKGMRNWSALQMMLIHLSKPSLKAILNYATPKTLFFALRTDLVRDYQSDNTISFTDLIEANKNLDMGEGQRSFKYEAKQINGIYLFYELYNYFMVLGNRFDMTTRVGCVNNLIRFLENPPEDYCLGTQLIEKCFWDISEFKGISVVQNFGIRKFGTILSDICYSRSSKLVREGYAACRDIYLQKFAPRLLQVIEIEDDDEEVSRSSKKVKVMSQPEYYDSNKMG